jgi:hypothetical protein
VRWPVGAVAEVPTGPAPAPAVSTRMRNRCGAYSIASARVVPVVAWVAARAVREFFARGRGLVCAPIARGVW